MTCPELDDRLFDEDCRSALLGRGDVPRDVAEHLGACVTCAQEWSRAAAEAAQLSRLLVAPPAALRGRLLRAFRAGGRRPARGVGIDVETVCSTIALGALGAGLAGGLPGFSEWAGFVVGASLGVVAEAVRRATPNGRVAGPALSRVLRRCLASLVPVA